MTPKTVRNCFSASWDLLSCVEVDEDDAAAVLARAGEDGTSAGFGRELDELSAFGGREVTSAVDRVLALHEPGHADEHWIAELRHENLAGVRPEGEQVDLALRLRGAHHV